MIQKQKRIGFWQESAKPSGFSMFFVRGALKEKLPRVEDHIDQQWDPNEQEQVLEYLDGCQFGFHLQRNISVIAEYGTSLCRICECENGSKEYSNSEFTWPEGLAHYIRKHHVRPPQEFIDYVLGKTMAARRRSL